MPIQLRATYHHKKGVERKKPYFYIVRATYSSVELYLFAYSIQIASCYYLDVKLDSIGTNIMYPQRKTYVMGKWIPLEGNLRAIYWVLEKTQ